MIQKKFNKSYDDVLVQAYVFHTNFVANKADFIAFSSIFADPYGADFLDLIQDADEMPTFEDDQNEQAMFTLLVEETMEKARNLFKKLTFTIDIGWPKNELVQRAFRVQLYESSRQVPQRMINLLQNAYLKATSVAYNADLIANGFSAADITMIDTLSNELTTRTNDQQNYLDDTFLRTENRTEAFNKVWDEMVKISNASKMIFKDSPARIEVFLLYPEGPGPGSLTAPQNFMFDPVNYDFSWSAVENATSYILQSSTDGTNWTEYWAGHETTCAYEESPTTIMYFRVLAHNAGGNSAPSTVIQYDFAPVLVAPTNFNYDYNTYYFTWNAVPNAEYYEFQYRAQTNPTWNSLNAGSATGFYHADPPGDYLARVRAVSGTTMGPWSVEEEYSVGAP